MDMEWSLWCLFIITVWMYIRDTHDLRVEIARLKNELSKKEE